MHERLERLKGKLKGTPDYFVCERDVHRFYKGMSQMGKWKLLHDPLFPGFPITHLKFEEWVQTRRMIKNQQVTASDILNYMDGVPRKDKDKWSGKAWIYIRTHAYKYYPNIPKESLSGWQPEDAALMESLTSSISPVTLRKLNKMRRRLGISTLKPPISTQILALSSRIALRKKTGGYYMDSSVLRNLGRRPRIRRSSENAS